MNTGVDDVANLSRKLAAMLQGWGGKSLLDSYESERKPVAVRNTLAARAIAKQVGVLHIPAGMEEDTPAGAAQRQEVGAQVATYLGAQFSPIGVELGARYDGSPIIASDEAPPTDSIVQYIPTGQPGGRAPHSWFGAGRGIGESLYDRLGNGFTLLRFGPKSMSAIFILEGYGAIVNYQDVAAYMQGYGVSPNLLPLVMITELGGGLLILFGLKTRLAAIALAGFVLLAALLFHNNLADAEQAINFQKNLAIAGGFLFLAIFGPGSWSIDGWRGRQ
jgi:uncharacterized membrane protein YphA (DoxX/SURF4 family)